MLFWMIVAVVAALAMMAGVSWFPRRPSIPVKWRRQYSDRPGELMVFIPQGWQSILLANADVLRIASWLGDNPDTRRMELRTEAAVGEVVEVDSIAMPWLRSVLGVIAAEIRAEPVPVLAAEG